MDLNVIFHGLKHSFKKVWGVFANFQVPVILELFKLFF
jgi:hypothetical protein